MEPVLRVDGLRKSFRLHVQSEAEIPVFAGLGFTLHAGQALAVTGPSGVGKSSLLKLVYGTYKAQGGSILVRHDGQMVDMASASPREIIAVRTRTIGYVSQFLRVIPRVPTLEVVAEPLVEQGADEGAARERASALLAELQIPERLWGLSPVTFSGGEQQRVNIARGLAARHSILLLDEPTASLDAANRARVLALIGAARASGTAILGIFHDEAERAAACTGTVEVGSFQGAPHG